MLYSSHKGETSPKRTRSWSDVVHRSTKSAYWNGNSILQNHPSTFKEKEEELQWISSSATDPLIVAPKRAKNSFIIFQSYLEKITEKDMIILMEYLNAKVVMDNIEHERIMK